MLLLLQIPGATGACVSNNFVFCCPALSTFDTVIEIGFIAFDLASSYDRFWFDHFLSLSNSKLTTQPKSCQVFLDNELITLASCFASCCELLRAAASCFITSNERPSQFDPAPVQASPADRPTNEQDETPQPFD